MGEVDGIGFDTKTSPRQAAIEKTQAELRQEFDVREERKRELEFLENGGNPLDFKFGLSASISLQSTSVTNHLLEHEAKGSVALATFPDGDSAESSGHPGAPSLKEPNFADNLLFFDAENIKVDGKRNGASTGKRKGIASSRQPPKLDEIDSARETDDSSVFCHGVKSQAYARRNRFRSSHNSPQPGHNDRALTGHHLPLTHPEAGDAKIQHWEAQIDNHITVCNSNPTSSTENKDGQVHMDVDAIKKDKAGANVQKLSDDKTNITSKNLNESYYNDHVLLDGSEQEPNSIISTSTKLVDKGGETLPNGVTLTPYGSNKLSGSISKSCTSGFDNFCKEANVLQNEDQVMGECVFDETTISTGICLGAQPICVKANNVTDENTTNNHPPSGEFDGPCNGGRKEQKPGNNNMLFPDTAGDIGDLKMDVPLTINDSDQNKLMSVMNSLVPVINQEMCDRKLQMQDGLRSFSTAESIKVNEMVLSKPDTYQEIQLDSTRSGNISPKASCSQKDAAVTSNKQSDTEESMKLANSNEESILKEARLIEKKIKMAEESPLCVLYSTKQQKSHWDYVLEEMAWLANDFMQERLWKVRAASQMCRIVAVSGRPKFEKNNLQQKQREVAQLLAKAVLRFWNSSEDDKSTEENKHLLQLPIKHYATRFLQSGSSSVKAVPAEAPKTPDRTSDEGNLEMSWDAQLPDELLCYKVPFGAMHAYRESMETNWFHHENTTRTTNYVDHDASLDDSAPDIKMYEDMDDDEAETTMYYMPGSLEANRQKASHKKRKIMQQKTGVSRSYESGFDLPYVPGNESKLGNQLPAVIRDRPSALNVGPVPTKRVRTASRQRVISPFSVNATSAVPVTSKTDASSGDTNSFQDDYSTLQGAFYPRKNSEFESTVDYEKKPVFDGSEIPAKPKKKKKTKHMGYKNSFNSSNCFASSGKGSSYEQRWPVDSYAQLEQKGTKKRQESHHFESNGSLYVQQAVKKPKMLKQLSDTSPEAFGPLMPVPSPVASQMSNMSNSNKLIKVIPSRDRGRKSKALKVVGGLSGPGSTWSTFEDQTLVVLVHDMGPNWELISDAINSTVQFKFVFRDPKACKDRHKILMDKNSGDGGDSAEDSGSSQPYPSTLPGIPKGSARQLFECLQGPMEDTLKAHFEKIIQISQKLHSRRVKETLDSKQITPAHNSHLVALSQACPNNLAGSPLTPLDLCDATTSNSAEVLGIGYQGAPSNGLALPSYHGPPSTVLPATGTKNMLQGSPNIVIGSSFPSPSTAPNAPTRDIPRYGVPRPSSVHVDDQQRIQQYGQVISGRNVPGNLPVGADRGVRMLSSANGVGMVCGMSRGIPMTRPGFQGMGSPGVLNMVSSGSGLSSTSVGVPSPVNIHPGPGQGQGNSMMRPRDSLPMLRNGQNTDDHRQMIMQELQIQASQGSGQTFNVSAPFSNQPISSPSNVQSLSVQHQPPNQMSQQPQMLGNPHHPQIQGPNHRSQQQQAYSIRMAKERQLQQQRLVQQAPFSGPNSMPPLQNGSQLQQTAQSSPSTSNRQQQTLPRNSQTTTGMPNQMIKQRRHQIQQPSRQQPANPQAKLVKGSGRGSVLMNQNSSAENSNMNGPSATGNQVLEKHVMQQNQSMFNSSSNLALPQKPNQQKIYGRPPSQSLKQNPMVPSHPDGISQGQVNIPANQPLLSSQQSHVPSLSSQSQPQRQLNQNHQTMHRVVLHQSHQMNSDRHINSTSDPTQASQMMVSPNKSSDLANGIPEASSASVSASQWKSDQPYEASYRNSNAHLSSLTQPTMVGKEPLSPASSQGLTKRQFPGSLPFHGHGSGGHWQQQQQLQSHQPQQPQQQLYPAPQQMHRQVGQGAVYGRASNPGPG